MIDKVERIMKNYKTKLEQIDEAFVINTNYQYNELNLVSNETFSVSKDSASMQKDIKEKEAYIEKTKLLMEEAPKSEQYNYEKLIKEREKELEAIKREKALQDKIKKEILDKVNNTKVTTEGGREITLAERVKMQKNSLKDQAIRELTQESMSISRQLLEKKEELNTKQKEWNNFRYEFEKDENGNSTGKIINKNEMEEIGKSLDRIRKEMVKLNKLQKKCSNYLDELKQKTIEDEKFSKAWNDAYKKENNEEEKRKKMNKGQDREQNQDKDKDKGPNKEQDQNKDKGQNKEQDQDKDKGQNKEQDQDKDKEQDQDKDKEQDRGQNQGQDDLICEIIISKKAKIIVGKNEFDIKAIDVKKGINLSDEEVEGILNKYIDKEEERELAKQLIKNKDMDTTILNVISKLDIEQNYIKDFMNRYLNKCLVPEDEKRIRINYDANELSKVNIIKRILKREINIKEKNELLLRAKKQQEKGIARIRGDYKIGRLEKLLGAFSREKLRLPNPKDSNIDEVYEYNEKSIQPNQQQDFRDRMKIEENTSIENMNDSKYIQDEQENKNNIEVLEGEVTDSNEDIQEV